MIEDYKKEIQDIKIELAYQKEVVAGVTENIDVYQKQKILNTKVAISATDGMNYI